MIPSGCPVEKSASKTSGLTVFISPVDEEVIFKNPPLRELVALETVVLPPSLDVVKAEDDSI